jgi:hypothetical protein
MKNSILGAVVVLLAMGAFGCSNACDTLKKTCDTCNATAKSGCDFYVNAGNTDACKAIQASEDAACK